MNNQKEFRKGNYFYHFGNFDGQKFIKITKMNANKPSQQFAIRISSDIFIDYLDFNDFDCIGKKVMTLDKDCLLFDILTNLTSENLKDINGKIIEKIESPKIISDIPPKDFFQAKQINLEALELSFFFNEDSYQTIAIINIQEDLRSQIDKRRSDFKDVILSTFKECYKTLENYLNKTQSQELSR
jgi:hypothetical protein